MEVINVKEGKEYISANYPNDPLLKHIGINLLDQLPKVDIPEPAPEDNKLEKAIRQIRDAYAKAQKLGYIRNKLGWALYQVWTHYE